MSKTLVQIICELNDSQIDVREYKGRVINETKDHYITSPKDWGKFPKSKIDWFFFRATPNGHDVCGHIAFIQENREPIEEIRENLKIQTISAAKSYFENIENIRIKLLEGWYEDEKTADINS